MTVKEFKQYLESHFPRGSKAEDAPLLVGVYDGCDHNGGPVRQYYDLDSVEFKSFRRVSDCEWVPVRSSCKTKVGCLVI